MGGTVAISWGTTLPRIPYCSYAVSVVGPGFSTTDSSGSSVFIPATAYDKDYGRYTMQIKAVVGNGLLLFSTYKDVRIDLPQPGEFGRRTINITRDHQTSDFIRAVRVPNADVNLDPEVNLNLTGRSEIQINQGVHITGGRSSTKPGARLYTTATRLSGPTYLFLVGADLNGDGVRINGVRIDGGDYEIAGSGAWQDEDAVTPMGIGINSSHNVEIGNSEIYGWSGIGIQVSDTRDRLDGTNWAAVWIHDNYIHHNQRYRREGYGVQTHSGAHALIERNVFDYNRHSIESSGEPGTGYRAYNNLVGSNGGVNSLVNYTHVLDVHGTLDCNGYDSYCGPAGEYFDYRHNAIMYTKTDVLKVRGYPSSGADVVGNTFSHGESGAIVQTDVGNGGHHGVWGADNQFGSSPTYQDGCDFDGDGRADRFVATGANWWYKSAATGQYFYLATSRNKTGITLRHANGDGRCDVTDPSGTYINKSVPEAGVTARLAAAPKRSDIIATNAGQPGRARVWQVGADLTGVGSDRTITTTDWVTAQWFDRQQESGNLLGTGDFNADGAVDLLWRAQAGNKVAVTLLDDDSRVLIPGQLWHEGVGLDSAASHLRGVINPTVEFAGIGDFTGDGRADILWRTPVGQLWMWPAGQADSAVRISYHGSTSDVDEPMDPAWRVAGIGDFNNDGYSDVLFQNESDLKVVIWYLRHSQHIASSYVWTIGQGWRVAGIGDFDADGADDILWRHESGWLNTWFRPNMPGAYQHDVNWQNRSGEITGPEYTVVGVSDFDADGRADILWQGLSGQTFIWKMDGFTYRGQSADLAVDHAWTLRGPMPQAPQRMSLS
jgi:hypothetical protein